MYKESKSIVGMALILCLLLIGILTYAKSYKLELSGDEFYSYGLANSDIGNFYYQEHYYEVCGVGGWISGTDIRDWMEVQAGSRFQLSYVWKNQAGDVHPPFYYLLLNILCSIFIDSHSKAIGLAINVVACFWLFWGMTKWFALMMNQQRKEKARWFAWLPALLLLLTPEFFSIVQYIRMYTLLMAECVWVGYYLYIILVYKQFSGRQAFVLYCMIVLGGLTHYYFYVYAFFGALFVGIVMILRHMELKKILAYAVTWAVGVISCFLIFPASFRHLFFSYRAKQVQENIIGNEDVFSGYFESIPDWIMPTALLLVICALGITVLIKKKGKSLDKPFCIITASAVVATGIIMKTSIYTMGYYIAPFYTYVAFAIAMILIEAIDIKPVWGVFFLIIVCAITGVNAEKRWKSSREAAEYQESVHYAVDNLGVTDCYFVQEHTEWQNLFDGFIGELARFDEWTIGHEEEFPEGWFFKVMGDRITGDDPLIMLIRKEFWEEQQADYKAFFSCLAEYRGYLYLLYEG